MIAWLRARWLRIAIVFGVTAALAAGGCAQLAEKELKKSGEWRPEAQKGKPYAAGSTTETQ